MSLAVTSPVSKSPFFFPGLSFILIYSGLGHGHSSVQWFKKSLSLSQVPGVSRSCYHLAAASRCLQLEDNASLLKKDSFTDSHWNVSLFPPPFLTSQGAACVITAFSPFPLSPVTEKQLFLWWEAKKGISILLDFLVKFLSSPIKFLVCHTKNKDALILMQCEVSFAQKLERSKCPRNSRSFRCYMLTLFLALAVLFDDTLFSWDQQTVCF